MLFSTLRHVSLAAAALALFALGGATTARAADAPRISGPVTHANLALYFIHGPSAPGTPPLTLEEALGKGLVRVYETGSVNALAIENLADSEVFVQSGDIVKGGQQDRVLTVSLLLPAKSGRIGIASFCVEHGRWSARGGEDAKTFASAATLLPSRSAKMALEAPSRQATTGGGRDNDAVASADRQQAVWQAVAETQAKLSAGVGAPVAAPQSLSSLQLSLENKKLKEAQDGYRRALQAAGAADGDIVGVAFAVNGRLSGADVYESNALFRKMWSKLLLAAVTEAIGERKTDAAAPPPADAVRAMLEATANGTATDRTLPAGNRQETRVAAAALSVESRRDDGRFTHRSYLAK